MPANSELCRPGADLPWSRVSSTRWEDWPANQVDVEGGSLVVVPDLGAKIVSLALDGDSSSFLWRDETRPYRTMTYGDEFGKYDASGFDECFPTIGECPYPDAPWKGIGAPDHGELWTARWAVETDGQALITRTEGVRFPYRFERRIAAGHGAGTFAFRYRVGNLSDSPMKYLWSAHPLLVATPGMQVLIPGRPRGWTVFAGGGRIAESGELTWPNAPTPDGGHLDYSLIGGRELRANDKVCVETPSDGWCALFDPAARRFCGFRICRAQVPYIAVCINHSWWPFAGRRGYWVALEPCTGFPDRLDLAAMAGRHRTLEGGGRVEWFMALMVGKAGDAGAVAEQMTSPG